MSENETFENLPFNGKCKNLIDKFLIIGYDKITFKNILNNFFSKINDLNENKKKDESKNFNDIFFNFNQTINLRNSLKISSSRDKRNYRNNVYYTKKSIDEAPLILNEFMYDFNKSIIDNEKVIEITFPNKYYIFYNVEENIMEKNIKINKAKTLKNNDSFIEFENKPYPQNIIFSISPEFESTKKNQNGISHIFYQSYTKKEKNKIFHIYFPIVFTIISEFPFWSKYITIFNLIEDLYLNQKDKYLDIHQIIYNLVSFTPSPLNSDIKINLKSIYKTIEYDILVFPMIDSFPIIDYNLGKIFLSISTLNLITLFIITFLEKEIIFFSSNLEELNLFIYTFLILNFPLNDSQYYWFCVSVSKDSYFKRESPFVEKVFSSLLGINNEFNIKKYNNKSNELYFYDIENDVLKINDNFKDNNNNIISTVKYLIKKESNYNIKAFYDKIENLKKSLLINNLNEEFFKISEYEKKNNENIQNLFFEFNLFLCSHFLNNIKTKINEKDGFIIDYDKNILIDKKKNKYIANFNQNFQESIKFQTFINNYIQNFSCLDIYKIPFVIFENLYFLKNKKSNDLNININDLFHFIYKKILNQNLLSLNVIDKIENLSIYKENNIDFTNYFNKQFSLYKNYEKNIIDNNNNKDDEFENIFIYELNNNDLFIYIYKLQELDKKTLLEFFPFINILENNVIYKTDNIFLEKQLELYYINKNCLTQESKISNCIISLYCILFSKFSTDCLNVYFSFIETIFKNNKLYILRYYYYLILHILNTNYDYSKNSEMKNNILDIINIIIKEILIKQNIFPNALIFQFFKKFEKELKNRKINIINKEDFFKSFSVKIINRQNNEQQLNFEILKNINFENQNNIKIIVKFDENKYESDYLNINQIYSFILQEQNILLNQNLYNKFDYNLINQIIISLISITNILDEDIFSSDDINSCIQILGEFLRLINGNN